MRKEYKQYGLSQKEMASQPFRQFDKWFGEALQAGVEEPNVMTLSTTGKDGKPSGRIVLLKSYDENGFVFYSNYASRKGEQMLENPFVALSFFWQGLERQVRIEGTVEKISRSESDEYFNSRPRGSRLAAIASPQSKTLESRSALEKIWNELDESFRGKDLIPRPENWGGYCVKPVRVEFWQGRDNRMHDRIVYLLERDKKWTTHRLAP